MRRHEKEIKTRDGLEEIINEAKVLRVAMCVDNLPYIVPVNFGFEENAFYYHCAKKGKKLDMIKKNPNVSFEIDINHELVAGDVACKFTMKFKSIIGSGKAFVVNDKEEKIKGLNIIMSQYSDMDKFEYNDKAIDNVLIVKIEVSEMAGKQSGY